MFRGGRLGHEPAVLAIHWYRGVVMKLASISPPLDGGLATIWSRSQLWWTTKALPRRRHNLRYGPHQSTNIERLAQIINGAGAHALLAQTGRVVRGNDNDRKGGTGHPQ